MTTLATDNFNRSDSSNLGSNWTQAGGVSYGLTIYSNQARVDTAAVDQGNFYNAVSWPDDQWSKAKLTNVIAATDCGHGPAVRMSASALTMYLAQCNTTEIRLYRVVSGSWQQLGSDAAAAANNDIIEIRAEGTSITVLKNGSTIIGPITDGNIASGNAGLRGYGTAEYGQFDDWEGGDFNVVTTYGAEFQAIADFSGLPQPALGAYFTASNETSAGKGDIQARDAVMEAVARLVAEKAEIAAKEAVFESRGDFIAINSPVKFSFVLYQADGETPKANWTGLRVAWWRSMQDILNKQPAVVTGSGLSTDGNGLFEFPAPGDMSVGEDQGFGIIFDQDMVPDDSEAMWSGCFDVILS